MMYCMFSTCIVSILIGFQPLCTETTFVETMGSTLEGELAFVARAVFDDYIEESTPEIVPDERTPAGNSQYINAKATRILEEANLFEECIQSLRVLNDTPEWLRSVATLRRKVLLEEREANNPWSGAVWVYLPTIDASSDDFVFVFDSFLDVHSQQDRADRVEAIKAQKIGGDISKCTKLEQQVMARWWQFYTLIKPYITSENEQLIFPTVNNGEEVHTLYEWIVSNVTNQGVLQSANAQFSLWQSIQKKQRTNIVDLVLQSRKEYGYDPLSHSCGDGDFDERRKVRLSLMRSNAAINELNNDTIASLLQLLSEELREEYKSSL